MNANFIILENIFPVNHINPLKYFYKSVLILLLVINCNPGFSQKKTETQDKTDSVIIQADSLSQDSIRLPGTFSFSEAKDLLRAAADSLAVIYAEQFKEKQIYSLQLTLLGNIKRELLKATDFIKRGLDTNDLKESIDRIESEFKIAAEGTDSTEGVFATSRNSKTSELLMKELVIKLDNRNERIDSYLKQLREFRTTVDSMQTIPYLLKLPKDSALFSQYFQKILMFSVETIAADSALTTTIKNLDDLESRIEMLRSGIMNKGQQILSQRNLISINQFTNTGSFDEVLDLSVSKDLLLLKYFWVNNIWLIILMIFFAGILSYLNITLRKKIRNVSISQLTKESDLILRFPVLTAVFIILMIMEFFFPRSPLIFQGTLWITASIILTIILYRYQTHIQKFNWLFLFAGFVVVLVCDLIVGMLAPEKTLLLIMAAAGLIINISAIRSNSFFTGRIYKNILLIITSFLLLLSILLNFAGFYNSAKSLVSASYFILITAYLLYWVMILGIEFINLFSLVYETDSGEKLRVHLQRFRVRTPIALKIFVFAGWIILLARNFLVYDFLLGEISYFFEQERMIGDFKFTIGSIVVFILIIFASAVISKIIALIAERADSGKNTIGGLSNWMLLIRIAVLTAGVLLAFAATGIPVDRLTIIIGSLGIGIGLGLQSIVNNLVSGILLAFEKPFRIGDRIEISDKAGRIKEIGIRSSKIVTSDGSTIIIPNGDLLSKVVTNWTLSDSNKRTELLMSFKYGKNLNELKSALQKILENHTDIIKQPVPVVLLNNYGATSVEYKLQFWTDISDADRIKSELIMRIEEEIPSSDIEADKDKS